jgi:hypothetical protein
MRSQAPPPPMCAELLEPIATGAWPLALLMAGDPKEGAGPLGSASLFPVAEREMFGAAGGPPRRAARRVLVADLMLDAARQGPGADFSEGSNV